MSDQDSIDVREMMRSPGWAVVERDLQDLILADTDRIRSIDVDGKTAQDIGTEYLHARRHVDGLLDALSTVLKHEQ